MKPLRVLIKNDVDFKLKTDTAVPLQSVTKSSNLQHLFHLFDSLQQTLLLLLDVDFKLKSATEADFSLNLDGWARDPTRSVFAEMRGGRITLSRCGTLVSVSRVSPRVPPVSF